MKQIIDKTLEQMSAHFGLAGAAMLVVKEGETALKYCWGRADVTTGRPVTETCYVDIASNSKAFTTVAIYASFSMGVYFPASYRSASAVPRSTCSRWIFT